MNDNNSVTDAVDLFRQLTHEQQMTILELLRTLSSQQELHAACQEKVD